MFICMAIAILGLLSCSNNADSTNESEASVENEEVPVEKDVKLPFKIVDNVIFNENVPVVVDFYADWCKPCQEYTPVFQEVSQKYGESVCFISLNTEEYPALCETYKITSIPATVFIMPGGSVLGVEVGVMDKTKLETLVDQLIATSAGADMEI